MYEMSHLQATRPKRPRRFVVTVTLLAVSVVALVAVAFVVLSGGFADAAALCGGG